MSFSYVGFHIFWDPTSFSQFTPSFWRSIFFTSFPRKVNQDLNFIKMSIFYPDMSLTILPSIDFQDRHFPQNFEGVSTSSSGFSGAVEKFHATLVLIPLSSFFFLSRNFQAHLFILVFMMLQISPLRGFVFACTKYMEGITNLGLT